MLILLSFIGSEMLKHIMYLLRFLKSLYYLTSNQFYNLSFCFKIVYFRRIFN